MSVPTLITFLLLVVCAVPWRMPGAVAALFQLEEGSAITGPPDQTFPDTSDAVCAVRCAGLPVCGGFRRDDAGGSCQLFRQPSFTSSGGGSQGQRSFRRAAPVGCPPGFILCADLCLSLSLSLHDTTYTAAEAECARQGGHLAVPRSEAENQCIIDNWTSTGTGTGITYLWLGVSDTDGDGVFMGVDGLGAVPTDQWWAGGEPNGKAPIPEPYVMAFSGGWGDAPGSFSARPLCQIGGLY